jgi:two-component sensor histidine kinase
MYARDHFPPTATAPSPIDSTFGLSESNHRISNNLAILSSGISLRARQIVQRDRTLTSDEVSLILGEVSARISTVAWLHRFLSTEPGGESVDLNGHLYELCETLISALAEPKRMTLVRIGERECIVGTSQVVSLCLIVTEAVTNALKYAHPTGVHGTIAVGCRRQDDDTLVVEVADDGVGLPDGFDMATEAGLGARTIKMLAGQLGAEFDFRSGPIGLRFLLRVPPPAPGRRVREAA